MNFLGLIGQCCTKLVYAETEHLDIRDPVLCLGLCKVGSFGLLNLLFLNLVQFGATALRYLYGVNLFPLSSNFPCGVFI